VRNYKTLLNKICCVIIFSLFLSLLYTSPLLAWDFEEHVKVGKEAYNNACENIREKIKNNEIVIQSKSGLKVCQKL